MKKNSNGDGKESGTWGGGAGYKSHKTIVTFLRRSEKFHLVVKFYPWNWSLFGSEGIAFNTL